MTYSRHILINKLLQKNVETLTIEDLHPEVESLHFLPRQVFFGRSFHESETMQIISNLQISDKVLVESKFNNNIAYCRLRGVPCKETCEECWLTPFRYDIYWRLTT